jgi:hypothetical protein
LKTKRMSPRPLAILSSTFHLSLIILLWCSQCAGQNKDRLSVLKACENIFGKPIDINPSIYELNSEFVLQPHFDTGDYLTTLEVVPKYFLHDMHPEWIEPDEWPLFSKSKFQSLLSQLDNIIPRGKLVRPDDLCVVSNNTCPLLDKYENAYVHRWQTGNDIRCFELYPFHEILGKIIKRAKSRDSMRLKSDLVRENYRVLVGKSVYDIESDVYVKLHPGQTQKFLAVGPIKGHCLVGFCNP